jgi:hypothetical protein
MSLEEAKISPPFSLSSPKATTSWRKGEKIPFSGIHKLTHLNVFHTVENDVRSGEIDFSIITTHLFLNFGPKTK